jgi:hypothetical protein
MAESSSKHAVRAGVEATQGLSKKDIIVSVLSILFTISLCVVAIYYRDYLLDTKYIATYGLLGMLILAFLGGSLLSMIAVPVPCRRNYR